MPTALTNLELQGIEFEVETLMEVYTNRSGNTVVVPIIIRVDLLFVQFIFVQRFSSNPFRPILT